MSTTAVAVDDTPLIDDGFLVLLNAWCEPLTFLVPADLWTRRWGIVCDTNAVGRELAVGPRSLVVLLTQT